MKRIICILALVLTFSCLILAFAGCNNDKKKEVVYKDYTVTVVDGLNNPVPDVIVKFTYPDGTTKSRVTLDDGIASLKNVPEGEYKVNIEKGLSTAVITTWEYTLNEVKSSLNVIVRDEEKTFEVYGEIPEDTYAYSINASDYEVWCEGGKMSYVVFYAQTPGTYKVSLGADDKNITVGYYGIPMFVQTSHRLDGEYDGRSFELVIHDVQAPYVIGISSSEQALAHLSVERIGDTPFDPQYAPWTNVEAEMELTECDLPDDVVIEDFDVAADNLSVTLRDDGYYYTDDGKLVYIRIGSPCYAKYLDVSIAYIAGFVDHNFGQNFGGYVYDENGEFVGKYSFNNMIESYYEMCDSTGLYPLTEELARAIQVHGNSAGWWKPGAANYLFEGVDINPETAWLFLCCTVR